MGHIKTRSKGSTGGFSGLTYDTIKLLPEETQRQLHRNLVIMWKSRFHPEEWKWKYLCPIPKPRADGGETTTDDLRPLMLLEVDRKAWEAIIDKRTQRILNKHKMLDEAQSGFRNETGTDACMLQLQNAMEEAEEIATGITLGTWDSKKAFDTVNRYLIPFIYWRLGIPAEYGEYLEKLDRDGTTIIKSPLALETAKNESYEGFGKADSPETFTCERGAGQGGSSSPSIWNANYDILLSALRLMENKEYIMFRTSDDRLHEVRPTAYADDLATITANVKALQRNADLVSGFAMVFGIEVALKKLRLLNIEYGSENADEEMKDTDFTIKIHTMKTTEEIEQYIGEDEETEEWNPKYTKTHFIEVKRKGSMLYLGNEIDALQDGATQMAKARSIIGIVANTVLRKKASTGAIMAVISKCLIHKIGYAAQFNSWDLKEYQELLDVPFNKIFRAATKNMASYPTKLIYATEKTLGLGIERLSDIAQISKRNIAFRNSINPESDAARAVDGLLTRGARYNGIESSTGNPIRIQQNDNFTYWAKSLLEWLDMNGLAMIKNGIDRDDGYWDQPVRLKLLIAEKKQIRWCEAFGIHRLGDLVKITTTVASGRQTIGLIELNTMVHEGTSGDFIKNIIITIIYKLFVCHCKHDIVSMKVIMRKPKCLLVSY